MSNSVESTPLYIHTLETLCKELVSGRSVIIDNDGNIFSLNSPEARSVFNWYIRNQSKWTQRNQKQDIEAIVDALDNPPPSLPPIEVGENSQTKQILHLNKIRVHRFAGIQRFGKCDDPPEFFEFDFSKPVTLIQGTNGSGKTRQN